MVVRRSVQKTRYGLSDGIRGIDTSDITEFIHVYHETTSPRPKQSFVALAIAKLEFPQARQRIRKKPQSPK